MTLLLNPKYEHLRPHLKHIESLMARGEMIHKGRNRLCTIEIDGLTICIKAYRKPMLINRFVYRFFRKTKGFRAWLHADILRHAGFDTPENVAYIQNNTLLGIGICYYICLFQEGKTLYHWGNKRLAEIQEDVRAFARQTACLHQAGLLLNDYTPGNILQTTTGFAFVDTNRMRQGRVSIQQGLKNMAGLWIQPEVADFLAQEYLAARGAQCEQHELLLMRKYRKDFWRRFAKKHHLDTEKVHTDLNGNTYQFNILQTIQ